VIDGGSQSRHGTATRSRQSCRDSTEWRKSAGHGGPTSAGRQIFVEDCRRARFIFEGGCRREGIEAIGPAVSLIFGKRALVQYEIATAALQCAGFIGIYRVGGGACGIARECW